MDSQLSEWSGIRLNWLHLFFESWKVQIHNESANILEIYRAAVMMPSPGGFLECRGYELVDSPDDSTPVPPIVWFPPPVPIRSSSLKYELFESPDDVTLPLNWFHPPVPIRSSSLTRKAIPFSMELTDDSGYQVPRKKLLQKKLWVIFKNFIIETIFKGPCRHVWRGIAPEPLLNAQPSPDSSGL